MTIHILLLPISRRLRLAVATFRQQISIQARRRRDRQITRQALQYPRMAAFAILYLSGCDQSLSTLTDFDQYSFRYLLTLFKPLYDVYSPYSADGFIRRIPDTPRRRGRPRLMDACQCLALTLTWYRTPGSEMVLCMLFGVTTSVCSLFIRYRRRLFLQALAQNIKAAVRLPCDREIAEFHASFASTHSMLMDFYAVADGLKYTWNSPEMLSYKKCSIMAGHTTITSETFSCFRPRAS